MSKTPFWYKIAGEARNDLGFERTLRSHIEDYLRHRCREGWFLLKEEGDNHTYAFYTGIMAEAHNAASRYAFQQKQHQELVAYLEHRFKKRKRISVTVSIWSGPIGSLDEFLEKHQKFTVIGIENTF